MTSLLCLHQRVPTPPVLLSLLSVLFLPIPSCSCLQLQSSRAAYGVLVAALADESKLVRWYRARQAGLPTAAIAAALAAVRPDMAAMAAVAGAADADTIITAKVEALEEKQAVMRQLVEVDRGFLPPPDYKVCLWGG